MGLIKAAMGAVSGTLADQWKDYYYRDAMKPEVLVAKGRKRGFDRATQDKSTENIITDGSGIAVADGQCMIIVEQGKVVELCAEPGVYTYNTGTTPSVFAGNLTEGLVGAAKDAWERFQFGGGAGKDQRIYYFNTKEILGNKYGTANPVPFRVVDQNIGLDIDISIRCNGEFSYKIVNPMLFYTNVCGNVKRRYERSEIDSQLRTELLTALQPAFAKISAMGVRYSAIPGHTTELAAALNEILSKQWAELRGIQVVSFGVNSIKASDEDEQMIKELQRAAVMRDPNMAAATMVGAQASAMQAAAANEGGAMMGFMGLGMANQAGGASPQNLFAMGQQQAAMNQPMGQPMQQPMGQPMQQPMGQQGFAGGGAGGAMATPATGQQAAPAADPDAWTCGCGAVNTGKFCQECGAQRPQAPAGWTCACGAVNKGKFCAECGAKKPEGARLYKCDKCGWEPDDPANPPKFCPECGDLFDESDVK